MNADTKTRFVGLIGLGSIAVWLTLSLGSGFYLSLASLRWPRVPVHITSSGVNAGTSNIGNWWAPAVEYTYELQGRQYHSTNVRYLMPAFYQEQDAKLVQAAYPEHTQTMAACDPRNPSRSVLEPGVPPNMWIRGLIPVFFWALMGYILFEIRHPERRFLLRSVAELSSGD